jgi:hypothetical protein
VAAVGNVSLYLDVDGVICPFGPTGTTDWGTRWKQANAGMLEVAYAGEVVDGLNQLARTPGVRCLWLTSWLDYAPEYLCPAIGLAGKEWPVLAGSGVGAGQGWWKLLAIQRHLESTGPDRVVWVDDQLRFERDAAAWARFLGGRFLPISPDPRRGLSKTELETVRAFVGAAGVLPLDR